MFTLADWILFGFAFATFVGVIAFMHFDGSEKKSKIIAILIEAVLMIALIGGCAIYNTFAL